MVIAGPSSSNGLSYAAASRNKSPSLVSRILTNMADIDQKQKKNLGEESSKVRESAPHAATCHQLLSDVGRNACLDACLALGEAEGTLRAVKPELLGMQQRIV